MLKGISKSETVDYISERDLSKSEADGATVFVLGAFDVSLKVHIQDLAMSFGADGVIQNKSNFKLMEAARFGIRGWRNFKDDKGNDIEPKFVKRSIGGRSYEYLDEASSSLLPFWLVQELGNQVLRFNTMVGEQGFTTP